MKMPEPKVIGQPWNKYIIVINELEINLYGAFWLAYSLSGFCHGNAHNQYIFFCFWGMEISEQAWSEIQTINYLIHTKLGCWGMLALGQRADKGTMGPTAWQ